jgi:hypothetical protein
MGIRQGVMAAMVVGMGWGMAWAQVFHAEDFESGRSEWTANGQTIIEPTGGNPGAFLYLPLGDFWGMTLRNEAPGSAVTGDLTRHGGAFTVRVDMSVMTARTFWWNPIPPEAYPLVLEFVDYGGGGARTPASVYTVGRPIPAEGAGWERIEFVVPDPTSATLPAGWGGTGAEDPFGDPMLPPDRTYRSVMENVDEVRITTIRPGWFYAASFWEAGYDNVEFRLMGTCRVDLNGDGVVDFNDLLEFLNLYNAGDPVADFNGDGVIDFNDFLAFLNEFNAGC